MENNYNIKKDKDGKDICFFSIDWVDENGKKNSIQTRDVFEAETILGLLSGNITFGDLTP